MSPFLFCFSTSKIFFLHLSRFVPFLSHKALLYLALFMSTYRIVLSRRVGCCVSKSFQLCEAVQKLLSGSDHIVILWQMRLLNCLQKTTVKLSHELNPLWLKICNAQRLRIKNVLRLGDIFAYLEKNATKLIKSIK